MFPRNMVRRGLPKNQNGQSTLEALAAIPLLLVGGLTLIGVLTLAHLRVKFDGVALETAACLARKIPISTCQARAGRLMIEVSRPWLVQVSYFGINKRLGQSYQTAQFNGFGLQWRWKNAAKIPGPQSSPK